MNAMLHTGALDPGLCLGTVLAVRTLIEYLIYGGALLLVAGVIFFWALAIRKPRKRKRRHRHHGREQRNPTLAETGGLPPIKSDASETERYPR
jgi:hypothetical protein